MVDQIELQAQEKDGLWRVYAPLIGMYMARILGWVFWNVSDHSNVDGYCSEDAAKKAAEFRTSLEIVWI